LSSTVRPRMTGLIVFGSRIVSAATGFVFLVMVARWLAPAQLGLWEFIVDLIVFASYPAGFLTYWAARDVARGKVVGKTTLVLNLLASMLGVAIFLAFALASYSEVGSSVGPFILAVVLVPLSYWNQATSALVGGYNPAIGAYSLLASEPAKLIAAYPLLFVFKLRIEGVIIAIAVSYFVQAAVSTYQLRVVSSERVDFALGRKWLRDPYVPGLMTLTYVLGIADTFAASVGQRGTSLAGYYQAAFQVAAIVSYSTFLSVALYPLLLRERSEKLMGEVLEFSLLFAIPMAAGAIALAPQILYLLSPAYVVSSTALEFLSLSSIVLLVSTVFDQTLTGRERADLDEREKTRSILRSDLMFVPLANLTYSVVYIGVVFLLGSYVAGGAPAYQFATYWAVTQLTLSCVLVAVKARRLTGKVRLYLSRSLPLYVVSGIVMAIAVHYFGAAILPAGLETVTYGLRLALTVVLGAVLYFGVLVAVDHRVRSYARTFFKLVSSLTAGG